MNSQSSLTQDLINLIRAKTVTNADLSRAAIFTLDAVANAMAGRRTNPGKKLQQWAATQGSDAGRRAFLYGGLTHTLETDDLHRASVTHPGCVVVPAVFAMAEEQECSGPEILTAILHGFESMCRIGNAVGPTHYQIWHNTATCGPYGSAMAAATLMGLGDEQAMHALGNAGTQSSGVWEFLQTGAMSKHLHAGRAAESGLVAAQLAATGFTGPPAILEGDKGFFRAACPDAAPEKVLANADGRWELTQTSIKPWPSCRHTHPTIDAALEISATINDREIESVLIETYQAALDVCDRQNPDNEYAAKFSLYHTVAAALSLGQIHFDSFDEKAREQFAPLGRRVTVTVADPFASSYPESWGARVTVRLKDGETMAAERPGAKGDPEYSLDDNEMQNKAAMLLDYAGCDDAETSMISESVLALAQEGSDASIAQYLGEALRTTVDS